MNRENIVKLLGKLPADRRVRIEEKQALIRCPSHKGGLESNNSFSMKLTGRYAGFGRCWTCGYKASILELTGTTKENFADIGISETFERLNLRDKPKRHLKLSDWGEEDWREIKNETLHLLGARYAFDLKSNELLVWLPVVSHNYELMLPEELDTYILAKMQKPANRRIPSYINSPDVQSMLFPVNLYRRVRHETSSKVIVLVEGPRDALRLLQNGIPALAILGSNFTQYQLNILLSLQPSRVVLAFDGDMAGDKAIECAAELLLPVVPVSKFSFDVGVDPGNCSLHDLVELHAITRK